MLDNLLDSVGEYVKSAGLYAFILSFFLAPMASERRSIKKRFLDALLAGVLTQGIYDVLVFYGWAQYTLIVVVAVATLGADWIRGSIRIIANCIIKRFTKKDRQE